MFREYLEESKYENIPYLVYRNISEGLLINSREKLCATIGIDCLYLFGALLKLGFTVRF
jgi:hypothetical protein